MSMLVFNIQKQNLPRTQELSVVVIHDEFNKLNEGDISLPMIIFWKSSRNRKLRQQIETVGTAWTIKECRLGMSTRQEYAKLMSQMIYLQALRQ